MSFFPPLSLTPSINFFPPRSFLSSPTLLLTHPPTGKTYTIHRSLLSHTNLLLTIPTRRRTTALTLPSNISLFPLERTIEFLYTSVYTGEIPSSSSASKPQAADARTLREANPLIAAAAAGSIGVWGGAGPIIELGQKHGRKLSSYSSDLVDGWVNDYDEEQKDAFFSASTASTVVGEFADYEPELNGKMGFDEYAVVEEEVRIVEASPKERVQRHLEVFELAKRWEVVGLKEAVLEVLGREVRERRELVGELVREVYGTKNKDEELRGFVVELMVGDWAGFRKEAEMKRVLGEGGEFVVDLVERVKAF